MRSRVQPIEQAGPEYIQWLKKLNVTPNFWVSESYFEAARFEGRLYGPWLWICDPVEELVVFPPVNRNSGQLGVCDGVTRIWSDFIGLKIDGWKPEFLDYEYLYDPQQFLDLSGGRWLTFRKNVRKWPRANPNWAYVVQEEWMMASIVKIASDWLSGLDVVEDPEVVLRLVLGAGQRKVLLADGAVVGLNVWDSNWALVNYRLCLVQPGVPFLSEFLRYQFYLDMVAVGRFLVNDGGVLGRADLKRFKDKLNPLAVREVCSWVCKV